jgi:hypothetical protein
MSEWIKYYDDKLAMMCNGYVLIKPQNTAISIPLACPVCDMLMLTRDDVDSYTQKRCCEKCALKWADMNLKRWNEGWRPSGEEIAKEVKIRQLIPIGINIEIDI